MGSNSHGQLGLGDRSNNDGQHSCDRDKPERIEYFVVHTIKIMEICVGCSHSMAINDLYNVYVWGNNHRDQCGVGREESAILEPLMVETLKDYKIIEIKASGENSYARSEDDRHWLWGNDDFNQCSLGIRKNSNGWKSKKYPYYINDEFYAKTKMKIDTVYLGCYSTYIVASNI